MEKRATLERSKFVIVVFCVCFTRLLSSSITSAPPSPVTTIILIVSIFVTFYAAAKVFRIGILMTGKPPRIGEILRWINAPIGAMPDMEEKKRSS